MNKAYNLINWANNETPINEENLNKMSNALDIIDNRVVSMDRTLSNQAESMKQAVEAATTAQEAKEIAEDAAAQAKNYLENAEAVVGVGIATKDKAGLVKADDILIDLDGTLRMITTTTETTMPNSHEGRLLVNEIGGVCEQKSTTGKNLLDCRGLTTQTINGVTFTPMYDANGNLEYVGVNGTATENTAYVLNSSASLSIGEYILSGCPANGGASKYTLNVRSIANDFGAGGTFSIAEAKSVITQIVVASGTACNNLRYYPMIRLASVADPTYEPYTGGIPAPNPDYPQEIKKSVVSGIKTRGKNLVKLENLSTTSYGVSVTIDDGVVKTNGTANNSGGYNLARINLKRGRYYTNVTTYRRSAKNDWLETIQPNTAFEVVDESQIFVPLLWFSNGTVYNETLIPMICLEEYKDGVEPYTESAITLSNPIELYGIGDVQDVIEDGKVKKRFASVVFDGSSDEPWSLRDTATGGIRYAYNLPNAKTSDTTNGVRSINSNFIITKAGGTYNKNNCYTIGNDSVLYCVLNMTETLSEWKSYLQANPMTVVYELAEETTEILPTADQIALNSLATYDGITYLEFDSEVQPTFEGEYGTSKVGGYTLDGMLAGLNGELLAKSNADRLSALEATVVNNI